MKKIAVLAGGFSGEAEVSLKSASMIMENIDRSRFEPFLVVVSRAAWVVEIDAGQVLINKEDFSFIANNEKVNFDGVFIIIHGDPGENGVIQGYFDLIELPYTTGDVWNMSMTFNKAACNDYLRNFGIESAKNVLIHEDELYSTSDIISKLGLPVFVKPNNGGSSIAISKVDVKEALHSAINRAMEVDDEVVIESFIEGTELTCGVVVKDDQPFALPITEIITENEFFDYEAKYLGQSDEITPARIMEDEKQLVHKISIDIFRILNCKGMIRVDFILKEGIPYLIEINGVPGFTSKSIIPQQASKAGISTTQLISIVIDSCF